MNKLPFLNTIILVLILICLTILTVEQLNEKQRQQNNFSGFSNGDVFIILNNRTGEAKFIDCTNRNDKEFMQFK